MKNTQAFSNYIEGEISFYILDNNQLEDIATSNRQGFVEDDERIILLINLLKPIVGYLIRQRVKLGTIVNNEERDYREKETEEAEKKRKQEDKLRIEAEKRKEEEEKQRKKVEQEKNKEQETREKEEQKVTE